MNFSSKKKKTDQILELTIVSIENKILNYPALMEKIAMDYKVW